ncbi:MAG: hypothetical protein FWG08_06540 [Propionibacteriaceae bacterium]|jgi:hypothetical protein|nr:hypothetical protein [Propionibacteriaceae bacterium]
MGYAIEIDEEELEVVRASVANLDRVVGEIAAGAYIIDTMFVESDAVSAEAMDGTLQGFVGATLAMQQCTSRFYEYLSLILDRFDYTDQELAGRVGVTHVNRSAQGGQ